MDFVGRDGVPVQRLRGQQSLGARSGSGGGTGRQIQNKNTTNTCNQKWLRLAAVLRVILLLQIGKQSMHGDFFMVQIFYFLEMDHLSSSTNSRSIWPKMSWSVEMFSSRIHDQWNHIWTSYQPPPPACRCLAHTIMRVFLSGHSIETLGMKCEVGILRISKLCTEQYFLLFSISIN